MCSAPLPPQNISRSDRTRALLRTMMRRFTSCLVLLLLAGGHPLSLRPAARTLLTTTGRSCRVSLCTSIAKPAPATRAARLPPALVEPDNMLVGGLAFLAGVADVMTFDHYGCYANMMTGNTFRAMGSLASSQWGEAAFHAALVLTYVTGVAAYRRVDLCQRVRSRPLLIASHVSLAVLSPPLRPSLSLSLSLA